MTLLEEKPIKKCEELKIYDLEMNPAYPFQATRKEAHRLGMWHKHFDCWITRRDIDDDYVIFQLRSDKKSSFKNCLEVTASGHIAAEEDVKDGIREVQEELGITIEYNKLRFLGIFRNIMNVKETDKKEREFCYTYAAESECQLEDFNLQQEEVAGVYEAKISDALKFFGGDLEKMVMRGRIKGENGYNDDEKIIYHNALETAFVPYFGNYYLRVMITLDRFLKGEKYLAI